jgi:hypothetical protein
MFFYKHAAPKKVVHHLDGSELDEKWQRNSDKLGNAANPASSLAPVVLVKWQRDNAGKST